MTFSLWLLLKPCLILDIYSVCILSWNCNEVHTCKFSQLSMDRPAVAVAASNSKRLIHIWWMGTQWANKALPLIRWIWCQESSFQEKYYSCPSNLVKISHYTETTRAMYVRMQNKCQGAGAHQVFVMWVWSCGSTVSEWSYCCCIVHREVANSLAWMSCCASCEIQILSPPGICHTEILKYMRKLAGTKVPGYVWSVWDISKNFLEDTHCCPNCNINNSLLFYL